MLHTVIPFSCASAYLQLVAEFTANVVARAGAMLDQQLQVGGCDLALILP